MDVSTKASITVSGHLTMDDVSMALLAVVKSDAIKDDSGLKVVSSRVKVEADGSADVEIVYVKVDASIAAQPEVDQSNNVAQSTPQAQADAPALNVAPAFIPSAAPVVPVIPTAN